LLPLTIRSLNDKEIMNQKNQLSYGLEEKFEYPQIQNYNCTVCRKNVSGINSLKIAKQYLPQVLIFHVERFGNRLRAFDPNAAVASYKFQDILDMNIHSGDGIHFFIFSLSN
jgi:ubiquitin C-terminal hydrolase